MFQRVGIGELRQYLGRVVGQEAVVGKVQLKEKVGVQVRRECLRGRVDGLGIRMDRAGLGR